MKLMGFGTITIWRKRCPLKLFLYRFTFLHETLFLNIITVRDNQYSLFMFFYDGIYTPNELCILNAKFQLHSNTYYISNALPLYAKCYDDEDEIIPHRAYNYLKVCFLDSFIIYIRIPSLSYSLNFFPVSIQNKR